MNDQEQIQNQEQQKPENKGGRYALKRFFTAKRMALMAVFVALSYVVSLFDFPIFPATPFLNSVTLRPSERITDGRRLPKRRKAIAAIIISWTGEPGRANSSKDITKPFD